MKILIVASPWLGGSGSVGYQLAKELAKQRNKVFFVSYGWPFKSNRKEENLKFYNIQPFEYALFPFPLYGLSLAEKIVEVALKEKVEIIHAHYGVLFGHFSLIAREALKVLNGKIKLVTTFHGSDVLGFDFNNPGSLLPTYLNKWLFINSDLMTVASKNLRDWLYQLNGKNRKAVIVPNFINTNDWHPKRKIEKDPHDLKIIHISNFRKVKRPLFVMKVFEKVRKQINVKMLMVGDGPARERTEEYAKRKKIKDVIFYGVLSEKGVKNLLQKSHLLLLPSLYENFSMVALEALACGVPVIASNTGGNGEFIKNGKNGFLIEPNHLSGFTGACMNILLNQDQWQVMSKNSRETAKNYHTDQIVNQYIGLYQSLLN